MRAVYEQDKISVENAIRSNQGNAQTYSDAYKGFKTIEIFEERYLEDLKDFLSRKNPALYGILLARNTNPQQQNARSELPECLSTLLNTVDNCRLLDTQESLSCLGHSVAALASRQQLQDAPQQANTFEAKAKVSAM